MPYKKPVKKICVVCNSLYTTRSNRSKYCENCKQTKCYQWVKKYNRLHPNVRNKSDKKWRKKRYKINKRNCKICNKFKSHQAHGMCINCYANWWKLNKKLSKMRETEKLAYLEKRGLLNKKVESESFLELTNELNKTYGVENE